MRNLPAAIAVSLFLGIIPGSTPHAGASVPPPSTCRLRRDPVVAVNAVSCNIKAKMETAL